MTPTNEPSTEVAVRTWLDDLARLARQVGDSEQVSIFALLRGSQRAQQIDAEITTLTDALTEARAALREVATAYHLTHNGGASGMGEPQCGVLVCQHAQSILKDAPKG